MSDKDKDNWPDLINIIHKLFKSKNIKPKPEPETKALVETKPPAETIDTWQYYLMSIQIPAAILARAASYNEAQEFLARTNLANLRLCEKNQQFINHPYDKTAYASFWGSIVALTFSGLFGILGGPFAFLAVIGGLSAATSYLFGRAAHDIHLKEMEFKRQSDTEECEDKLNAYASLSVGAIEYINAQIEIWNMRVGYLTKNLGEPTDKDRQNCIELRAIQTDFIKRVQRLTHFYELRQKEKNLAIKGIEMGRLHSKLDEHLADLEPIVPQISTDPLMLEAIKEMNAVFEQRPAPEPAQNLIVENNADNNPPKESIDIEIEDDDAPPEEKK